MSALNKRDRENLTAYLDGGFDHGRTLKPLEAKTQSRIPRVAAAKRSSMFETTGLGACL